MQSDDDTTILDGEEELDLPDELVANLVRSDKAVAVLSPEADRRIADAARTHFAQRPRRARTAGRRWAMAGSLAASLLVGVLFWRTYTPVDPPELMVATVARNPNDIDGSGAVDILDAFALARMANANPTGTAQARVDALAARIVALDGTAGKL